MELGSLTDVGREREHNEDNVLVTRFQFQRGSRRSVFTLLVVADGMGGAAAGEVASSVTIQTFADHLYRSLLAAHLNLEQAYVNLEALIVQAARTANDAVLRTARERDGCRGMGATLTAAVLCQGQAFIAQVGDSRCYLLRNNRLHQITQDHSLVGELLREGRITEEQARRHPRKNVITRAVGSRANLKIDVYHERLEVGDAFLLCSDGLSGLVEEDQMRTSMVLGFKRRSGSPAICRELVRMANDAGGSDNVSVVLARVGAADLPPTPTNQIQLEPEATLSWDEAQRLGLDDDSFELVEID